MKSRFIFLVALAGLAGCASAPETTVAALTPIWRAPHDIEIVLDGKVYAGPWTGGACHSADCRGAFRNVLKYQRRLVSYGEADPVAADGTRLDCRWSVYREEVEGVCRAADGRRYRLTAGRG